MMRVGLMAVWLALLFTVRAACSGGNVPTEQRWPQFRGLDGLGLAPDGTGLPALFGPATKLMWKGALPRGFSSPCIWVTRIFLTGHEAQAKRLETICLHAADGKVLWRRTAPAEKIEEWFHTNSPA